MDEINGVIDEIVFQNEENGYVVAKLSADKSIVTIVGTIPYLVEGQNLKLLGQWITHPKFGKQFQVKSCEEILPTSTKGIEKYLASGVIVGIGPITAKKIVNRFGENTLEILDNDIERLREVEGIGEKKLELIYDSYGKQRDVRNIMIFLQSYGIGPNQCMKIHKRFGSQAVTVVKENPYILCEEVAGIGFKTSDKIARSLGVEKDAPFRIQSGIKYVVNEFCAMGHTYIPKDKLVNNAAKVLLVEESIIERNIADCIIDGKIKMEKIEGVECIFTPFYYYCELSVTKNILTLATSNYDDLKIKVDDEIEEFQKENRITFADSQKEAIRGAFQHGIEIITGGPGTGKTTIINCIMDIFENNSFKVVMAAPTGRAAKRMTEATHREAKTIHRLLEMGFTGDETLDVFAKGEDSPLECDVIIIDEASMIDISLMSSLLKAIKIGTRLVIVGDVDQLPSVGPGNVLHDLIESGCIKVTKLQEIFRQSETSLITINAHKINNGEMPLLNKKGKDFFFMQEEGPEDVLTRVKELVKVRLPKFNKSWDGFSDIQILSPMRKGILGVDNLNSNLQDILNPKEKGKVEKEYRGMVFREGDKVMQTKNNYNLQWTKIKGSGEKEGLGVFNGDIGFIESIDNEGNSITIIFDDERRVCYEAMYLDELELAYAITIHKSQGSEFPVIVIPMFMGPPMLMNRNLIYTAITRAKELVVLTGSPKALKFMIENDRAFERYSSLRWRIQDILKDDIFNE